MARLSFFQGGETARTVCPYCGTGCGILARIRDGSLTSVTGDPEHPVNQGQLCAKGALLTQVLDTDDRLRYPHMRATRLRPFERASWDDAMGHAAAVLQRNMEEHGPDSIMFYGSGQLLTEDYYLLGKLAKGFIGTNNQDTNSRLCMSSAVVAYQQALGVDAPPCSYEDIEAAQTFLIVGANVEACHPILFNRIRARQRADARVRVIVVDPRRTRTGEIADLHLPVQPGADVPLLMSLLYEMGQLGGIDHDFIEQHTTGWEAVAAALPAYQAERVADVTGIPAQQILEAAHVLATSSPTLTLWTMGANQSASGVQKNLALINLALATGNIGIPGGGPFSLTGQPNAMGGREAGGLAGALPGHRSVANAEHRREVERAWGLPLDSIAPRPGLTAIEMIEALESGQVKVLWIAGSNPLASLPDTMRVQRAFSRAELVVVQDAYHPTETSRAADVLLPAAQWSERAGTMTNSERRICLLQQLGQPPGEALPDWVVFSRLARELGFGDAFTYDGPEAIFDEYRELTRGRDLDITGVTYELLATRPGGVSWPFPEGAEEEQPRLYSDGRFPTADGRARFHVPAYVPPADDRDEQYPLALVTGRVKDQWHTMTRTGSVPKLLRSEPQPFLEMHPADATRHGVREGDLVRVSSRRGSADLRARVTEDIRPGTVFAPFHWGLLRGYNTAPNRATNTAFDPDSKQPELKFAAVHVAVIQGRRLRAGTRPTTLVPVAPRNKE